MALSHFFLDRLRATWQVGSIAKKQPDTCGFVPFCPEYLWYGGVPRGGRVSRGEHDLQRLHEGLHLARKANGCIVEHECLSSSCGETDPLCIVLALCGCCVCNTVFFHLEILRQNDYLPRICSAVSNGRLCQRCGVGWRTATTSKYMTIERA